MNNLTAEQTSNSYAVIVEAPSGICEYTNSTSIGPSFASGRSSIGEVSNNRDIFKEVVNTAVPSIDESTGVRVTIKSAASVKSGSNSSATTLNVNGIADCLGNVIAVGVSAPICHASLSIVNPGWKMS